VGTPLLQVVPLPYDSTNPVFYDNDAVWESGGTDPLTFPLASGRPVGVRGGPPPAAPSCVPPGARSLFIDTVGKGGL